MKKKILLIEDHQAVRENICEILELAGYEVKEAPDGKKGVELAQQWAPDLIICDIMMPELDGYGVLHLLSKNSSTSSIPFIFLTAKTDRADMRKGMEMGADDFITKPFEDVELLNAVEARLRKSELLRTEFSAGLDGLKQLMRTARDLGKVALTEGDHEIRTYKKKEMIYTHGSRPMFLYYVVKGKAKNFLMNEFGKELIISIYKEGDFLGYNALLEETNYNDNAEALEDCELMLIPKSDFYALLNTNSQVAKSFIKILSHNLVEREEALINLAYNSLRKRVANGLLLVYDRFKKSPDDRPGLEIPREDLAQVVGTATESLIRTLSDFKSEKLIEIKDGKIYLLDEKKLRNLLN
ncbi:MAG: response regulator [Chitinophagales bacterium]|nr:response regulator [Chitinophagales bacterium]MDW8419006.1 response regulator [Chitinophagales bacterium]